jgi:hypothetical protein
MTITNGYTTLANFKAYAMPDRGTDAADDGVIEAIIEAVSRWIDAQTGRHFYTTSADETRYFTADRSYELYTGDLISVTTLSLDTQNDRTYAANLTSDEYNLAPYNASVDGKPYNSIELIPTLADYAFPLTARGVKVVGKFGWTTAPKDITELCNDIARSVYHRRYGQNVTGAATITPAGVVITPKDLTEMSRALLHTYRVIV